MAFKRSGVRSSLSPPKGDQANQAAIYFVGPVFILALPLLKER